MSVKAGKLEEPSETIKRDAEETVEIKDGRGRVIVLRRPGIVARMMFLKAIGDQPQMYASVLATGLFVKSINGEDVLPAMSEMAAQAIISRLGDDGFDAVQAAANEHFADASEADLQDSVKNS